MQLPQVPGRWPWQGFALWATTLISVAMLAACGGTSSNDKPSAADGVRLSSPAYKTALSRLLQVQQPTQAKVTLPPPPEGFEPMAFVNYETAHVHPMDSTPDGKLLLAVNTAAASLMVFELGSGRPTLVGQIPVGLEPVTVRVRSNDEAWVVNQVSDTVSRVDLRRMQVVQQINTADEPADVVFAGPRRLAFVSTSQAKLLQVFDPDAPRTPLLREVRLQGEDPRSLAVSPDGRTVYAAFFKSGNGTTTLAGGKMVLGANLVKDVLARPDSPYAGAKVPPNAGAGFKPALNPRNPPPPAVSLIVRKGADGRWRDDNQADWTAFVSGPLASASNRVNGWDLPDHDVAAVDAESLAVAYRGGALNIAMAMAVHPQTGDVTVVGTDATNEVRFEPNLNGSFVRVKMARFAAAGGVTASDLNPHLDYRSPRVEASVRQQSIGDPRAVAWQADGQRLWVAGMGSNNVLVLDAQGQRVARVPVGQGPTDLQIDGARSRVYVLNRFSASIDTLDLSSHARLSTEAFPDPTPAVVRDGRPLLYDTHLGSGLGQASCASCHVDGRTDKLAWDLGNPAGEMVSRRSVDGRLWNFHPMKGPLKTQTLVDIIGSVSLHHRGDKDNLAGFASSFRELQGRDTDASPEEIGRLERFLDTLHFGPNPYRGVDNALPTDMPIPGPGGQVVARGNAAAALPEFFRDCASCHIGARGRGDTGGPNQVHTEEPQAAEPLGGYYTRLGFFPESVNGSTSGFGTRHDATDSAQILLHVSNANLHALFAAWEGPKPGITGLSRDSHAGVGRQVMLAVGGDPAGVQALMAIAETGAVGLMAKGQVGAMDRGYVYVGDGWFQGDVVGDQVTLPILMARMANDDPIWGLREDRLTFMLVPRGSEQRLGIDADLDGLLDTQDPEPNTPSAASGWQACAQEGQACQVNGTGVMRYGVDGQWVYSVFSGAATCGNATLGDPVVGTVKRCELTQIDPRAPLPRESVVRPGNGADGLLLTVDDSHRVYVNGVEVTAGRNWAQARFVPLALRPGDVIAVEAADSHDVAVGLLAEVRLHGRTYGSSSAWKVSTQPPENWASPGLDDRAWPNATELGDYGISPWGQRAEGVPGDTPARWIWSAGNLSDRRVVFRYRVPETDGIRIVADDSHRVYVNGRLLGEGQSWRQSAFYPVMLKPDDVVSVEVLNGEGPGGLLAEVVRGGVVETTAPGTWKVNASAPGEWTSATLDDRSWPWASDHGAYGAAPWQRQVAGLSPGSTARWLWLPDASAPRAHFRYRVPVADGVRVSADDHYQLYVNAQPIGSGDSWMRAGFHATQLRSGDVVALVVRDGGGPGNVAAVLADIRQGNRRWVSGSAWRVATEVQGSAWMRPGFDASRWASPADHGAYGVAPWFTAVQGWDGPAEARWIWSARAVDDDRLYLRFVVP